MLTEFGVFTRRIRKRRRESMSVMAARLDITSSYLQMIECGKRRVPENIADKISAEYNLSTQEVMEVERAVELSKQSIEITLHDKEEEDKKLILMFYNRFESLSEDDKNELKEILGC